MAYVAAFLVGGTLAAAIEIARQRDHHPHRRNR